MAESFPTIEIDYKQLKKELEQFDKQMPNSAKKIMSAVNREVIKEMKKQARSRGYLAHNKKKWGDAGYQPNFDQYSFNDYKGEIFIKSNAFHYHFLEFGANVKPKREKYLTFKIGDNWYKSKGFYLPANPILYPIANSIWGTNKANEIMDKKMQEIMNKQFK